MAWRVATSLDVLLRQLNTLAPKRSKLSDGGIGNAEHASRSSDHNPWVQLGGVGIVSARDFTHDPANGLDCEALYQALVKSRDKRIKYVIWNRTITSGAAGPSPWVRRPYDGINAHTKHLHLSVVSTAALFDNAAPWNLGAPTPTPEDDMQISELYAWRDKQGRNVIDYQNFVTGTLESFAKQITALTAAVTALSNDPDLTTAQVKQAMVEALQENVVTVDVSPSLRTS